MVDQKGKIYLKQGEIKVGFGSTGETTRIENFYQVTEIDNNHKKAEEFMSSLSLP
jgi:hypothetical protein